jgi:condensin complex subunit 3
MPGRPSIRANRAAAAAERTTTKKVGSTTTRTRGTTAKSAVQIVDIPDEGDVTSLRERICIIFSDAQRGLVTQRKSAVNLRKIQELCCYETPNPRKHAFAQDANEYDESDFNMEVGRCVLRILSVKKSEPTGDKLVKFLGLFLKHASDKDNAIFTESEADTTEAFPETPTSRLTSHILNLALQVATVKDKVIRYRATQIIAHVVNTLDSIDDELFQLVRLALLRRLRDKENNIRVQAVLGLGRLADEGDANDEEDSDDEDAGGVLNKLLDVLQNDPSAEVRRALLLNLPFTPTTLPFLLERARDMDAATRRALYSRLLPALGDFRHLSLTHREKLLRWGLRDRDENVRKATARLFRERWIEDCAVSHAEGSAEERDPQKLSDPNMNALMELLERIDVVNSGVENGIAHEAMKQFWDGRPDYRNVVSFDDPYFDQLTAEAVFIARSFNQFCKESGDAKLESMREDKMPEVTKFAFLLQRHIALLIRGVELVALNPEDVDVEEDTVQQEFCVEQLLHVALTLDYSDEMGRRKMFSIMREALALAELPEECTKLVVDVLRVVCGSNAAGEQDFCSIVLEAVAEVHDTIMGEDQPQENAAEDDSFHSARSDLSGDVTPTKNNKSRNTLGSEDPSEFDEGKAVREIMVNMKCLHIAQCMLQNAQSDLEQNSHLVTMLNNLVVPAVRSQEAPIRERGLVCLGLCCLLSKNLAQENLTLFLHCFSKGHEALQIIAVQIVSDILISHPSLLAEPVDPEAEPNELVKPIFKMFSKSLRVPDNTIQTNGCVALSKLMLMGTIKDADLLKQMVLAYFDPDTQTNPSLRQSLTYFLPVYCHSKRENAISLAQVAVSVIHTLADRADDLDEEEEMVGNSLVVAQLCDWTDPRKLVPVLDKRVDETARELDAHIVLAEEVLEKILAPNCNSKLFH